MSWRQRLALTEDTEPLFEALLAGLGVSASAVQESPPSADRVLLAVELSQPERLCFDSLSGQLGISTRSAGKLARAVLRSFLVHPWNLPVEVDLGPIEDTNEWPSERAEPTAVFSMLLARVPDAEVMSIMRAQFERLPTDQLEALQADLQAELERRKK